MYPITRRNDPELSMDTESFAPVRVERLDDGGTPTLLIRGLRGSLARLLEDLDRRIADSDPVLGAHWSEVGSARVWLASDGVTFDDVADELRRASDLAGVDLVFEPEEVTASAAASL